MIEEEEGYDDEDRWSVNYFLTLLDLVLFPAVRASFIFSKHHTREILAVCGGGGQMREMGRIADERDDRWERWGEGK